ncbi:MAG: ACP S-malonyltransferase [Rhodospirillaceae bacterium]|nr:ACP S-malonyltransferase [Rhodospirillaceae bacterium]
MTRKTALVIAPGRGTYNKEELGYFGRYHADKGDLIAGFDTARAALGQETVSALDGAERFSVAKYSRGDNASGLIHACAYADFLSIDRDAYDIVAVTGNSMGWYIALACSGALNAADGFTVVNTMGTLMQDAMIGGQLLYPFVDEAWVEIPGERDALIALTHEINNLHISIHLGGMIVFAGDDAALKEAESRLAPLHERFPMRLANHAGFHSPLQAPVSAKGRAALSPSMFQNPSLPLIDGRGHIWQPYASDGPALWDYTLGHQVVEPYDFTKAVQNGVHEFAPDVVIVLGPGKTLGGAVAQALIECGWQGMGDKDDFNQRQASDPVLVSMGIDEQRKSVSHRR